MCFYLKILECVLPKNKDILLHKNKMLIKIRKLILCCSVAQSCLTLRPHRQQHARVSFLHYFPEFAQTHVHWANDAIQPSHPLSSPSPPAPNLSKHQGLFQWSGLLIALPKYWSFHFSISPSNEYSGLISFRIDRYDLLAVQGTQESSPTTTVQKHQFFSTQLSL